MNSMIGLVLMATAGAAQAQAQTDLCADVRSIVAAALETPAFASIPRYPEQRPLLGHHACFTLRGPGEGFIRWFDEGTRFVCDVPRNYPHERGWTDRDDLMSRIAACLPGAVRSGPEYRHADGPQAGQLSPARPRYSFYSSVYVDSGPVRFDYRTFHHSRFNRGWLTAYRRDADTEPR